MEGVTKRIGAFYREVFGAGLDDAWRRAIRREFRRGCPEPLMGIDARVLRATRDRCQKSKPPRRINLAQALALMLEMSADRAEAERRQAKSERAKRAKAAAEQRQQAEAGDDQRGRAERLQCFRQLPAEAREGYISRARGLGFTRQDDRVEILAVSLWAQDSTGPGQQTADAAPALATVPP